MREKFPGGGPVIPIKKFEPEQIVRLLRQIEVKIANGKTAPQACKGAAVTQQTYYRWLKEYDGLRLDQDKRLKELEKENTKLKRLAAELSLVQKISATSPLSPLPFAPALRRAGLPGHSGTPVGESEPSPSEPSPAACPAGPAAPAYQNQNLSFDLESDF